MVSWFDPVYALTLLPHYGWHRIVTGKYGPAAPEKLGRLAERSPGGPAWWFHAVSVGEVNAARTLVDAFRARRPGGDWRVSMTTATGREQAASQFGDGRIGYFPLDFSGAVRRAFDAWKPSLIVLMELEVWPNFLSEAARRKVPVAVANARITARSERRMALPGAGPVRRRLLESVALWLPQSDEYAERLLRLGVRPERIERVGSVKFDAVPERLDPSARRATRARLGLPDDDGPTGGEALLVAGSTHEGEEAAVLEAWKALRGEWPGLKLLVVPRHPERFDRVAALMAGYGPVTRWSALEAEGEGTAAGTALVLGDRMGRLSGWWAGADAAFVGGTLVAHGGQNFMEPCGLGVPTVCGESLYNFAEAASALKGIDGFRRVSGGAGLAEALGELLRRRPEARAMAARGRAELLSRRGATDRTLDALDRLGENGKTA